MPVLRNIGTLARCLFEGGQGDVQAMTDAAVAWDGKEITWVGSDSSLPAELSSHETIDAGGRLVAPGLVDCHTHLAFGGWREDEFVQRILGKTYLEIAEAGGGIKRSVRQTTALSEDMLVTRSIGFLDEMLRLGVTTVEAKSGYGLSIEGELKQLRAYRRISERHPVRLATTFLAHTIPDRSRADRKGYIDSVVIPLIEQAGAESLAEFCDVFIEEGAFTVEEGRHILQRAREAGMDLKVHADQLTDSGAAQLAAELDAVSADHLERISDTGIEAMSRSETVAVSLPFAAWYLNMDPMPARRLIDAGIPVAVATDFNPGTAPSFHLPFAMTLACVMQRMTPAEALKGATIFAARAIRRDHITGSIEVGKAADMVVVDAENIEHWLYHLRGNAAFTVICQGHVFTT